MRYVVAVMIIAVIIGCSRSFSARDAITVAPAALPRANDPLDHLCYVGSRDGYHYFHHAQMKAGASYRVRESDMSLPQTFPLGTREPQVVHVDAAGKVVALDAAPLPPTTNAR